MIDQLACTHAHGFEARKAVSRAIAGMGDQAIPPDWALALHRLEKAGRVMSVGEFGTACLMEINPSYALDRLEAQGLVVRRRVEHDCRQLNVELTNAGREWLARLRTALT